MKKYLVLLIAFALAALPAHAVLKSVTSVNATASTILYPGPYCKIITIQNNGSGAVRLSWDGGDAEGLPVPTASLGYLLGAGQQLILTFPPGSAIEQFHAILVSGTPTTLDITTDDRQSR